jgi:hypothetical protein
VDIGHVNATGDGKKDREQREVRVRVSKLETRAARWFGRRGIGSRCPRGGRTGRRGARNLIRLGAWEEGEQEFLASGRWRTNESNEPLVDSGAVIRTVLRQGHDVGVVKGVDDTSAEGFLGLGDQREGHLVDVARVREHEALVGVRVVKDGATDGRRGVGSEELLESAVRGGNPRRSADGEGLEEAFSALLADALTVLLSGSKHRRKQKGRKRRRGSTLWSTANANEESVRDRRKFDEKTTDFDPEGAEFGHSERSGAEREPREASMVTERQEEPQGAFKRRRTYSSSSTVYGDSSRGSRKK